MNAKKWALVGVATAIVLLISFAYRCGREKVCGPLFIERAFRSERTIIFPYGRVSAEVVDTPASRARGLSGRRGLAEGEGMLFVFDRSGRYGFWMKDMLFPIDIVWINDEGLVVHTEYNVSPDTYFKHDPPQTFINGPEARYVLEIGAGQSEKYGIYLGVKAEFQ